jgi:hypothetical protein
VSSASDIDSPAHVVPSGIAFHSKSEHLAWEYTIGWSRADVTGAAYETDRMTASLRTLWRPAGVGRLFARALCRTQTVDPFLTISSWETLQPVVIDDEVFSGLLRSPEKCSGGDMYGDILKSLARRATRRLTL